jgi:monoamine oxidase
VGHDVTILEARARPGGRVHTLRFPLSGGQYAEAGAGRIPATHKLTLDYVMRFKLALDPFLPRSGADVFFWRGMRQVVAGGGEPDLDRLRVKFTPREREAGFGCLGKAEAIRNLNFSPVVRVFVQTRTRLWEREGLNGFATVDLPMEAWCPTHDQPGPQGILMAYIEEEMAREYSALAPQEQIERTAALFERVHPGVRVEFETAATRSWGNEPYLWGAFTIARLGEFDWLAHAAAPEGRVHFASEHTSPWPCWIQGALRSGLRAAREVERAG